MAAKFNPDEVPQLRTEQQRAVAAKQILENEVFVAVNKHLREQLITNWINTAPNDVISREWFHQQAVAQEAMIKNIRKVISTGNLASATLASEPDTQRRT